MLAACPAKHVGAVIARCKMKIYSGHDATMGSVATEIIVLNKIASASDSTSSP
jgi:hypothetical protein